MIEVTKINEKRLLEDAWAIRKKVFVVEQGCPEDIEWEYEDESTHFLARVNGIPAGTARWRKTSKGIKLERFAVLMEFRSKQVGQSLLSAVLKDIPPTPYIYLHAQLTARDFYLKNGFVPSGEHFWEGGIEHVTMSLKQHEQEFK